jgi:hypothetical protein
MNPFGAMQQKFNQIPNWLCAPMTFRWQCNDFLYLAPIDSLKVNVQLPVCLLVGHESTMTLARMMPSQVQPYGKGTSVTARWGWAHATPLGGLCQGISFQPYGAPATI